MAVRSRYEPRRTTLADIALHPKTTGPSDRAGSVVTAGCSTRLTALELMFRWAVQNRRPQPIPG